MGGGAAENGRIVQWFFLYYIITDMKVLLVEDESKVANFVSRGLKKKGMAWMWPVTAGRVLISSPRGL